MMMKVRVFSGVLLGLSFAVMGEGTQPQSPDNVVYSSNIHAMVKVVSCDTNTIISVPWMFYTPDGASTTNLPVDRLVRPTNLTVGDYVLAHLPDPSNPVKQTFAAWELTVTEEPVPGVANPRLPKEEYPNDYCWKWEPVMTASRVERLEQDSNGSYRTDVWVPDGIATQTECRGYGVWLLRQKPTENGNAKPFYLYGQWTTGNATVTIKGGSPETPVCTMLANPDCLHATDVNELTWSNVGAADTLILTTDSKTTLYCTYKNGSWGYSTQTRVNKNEGKDKPAYWVVKTVREDAPEVPAGTGFWYVRRTSGDVTLTWTIPTEGTTPTTNE